MRHVYSSQSGFTLIEVMTSMVILSITVALVATIFNDATKAWDIGTRRVDTNNSGRAVVNMLAKELSSAIADARVRMRVLTDGGLKPYDFSSKSDQIAFVSALDKADSTGKRIGEELLYYVRKAKDSKNNDLERYDLMRAVRSAERCYSSAQPDWWAVDANAYARQTLVENVSAFEIRAYHLEADPSGPIPDYSSDLQLTNGEEYVLPTFIEIYLEVLDEKDAATAQMMYDNSVPGRAEFVERRAKRYTARVYPNNREGYKVTYQ